VFRATTFQELALFLYC